LIISQFEFRIDSISGSRLILIFRVLDSSGSRLSYSETPKYLAISDPSLVHVRTTNFSSTSDISSVSRSPSPGSSCPPRTRLLMSSRFNSNRYCVFSSRYFLSRKRFSNLSSQAGLKIWAMIQRMRFRNRRCEGLKCGGIPFLWTMSLFAP
jgi:hypothetical protein